jgi:hypothetical protein
LLYAHNLHSRRRGRQASLKEGRQTRGLRKPPGSVLKTPRPVNEVGALQLALPPLQEEDKVVNQRREYTCAMEGSKEPRVVKEIAAA